MEVRPMCEEIAHGKKVGCLLWALVNGKTQTDLPWGHRPGDPRPVIWQHDLDKGDFTPYDQKELDILKEYIKQWKEKASLEKHWFFITLANRPISSASSILY